MLYGAGVCCRGRMPLPAIGCATLLLFAVLYGRSTKTFSSSFSLSDTSQDTSTSGTKTAKALYGYTADDADELSFDVGDIITNVEDIDDGWAAGDCNGKHGLFPTNFVERI